MEKSKTPQEVIRQGYQVLVESLGVVDTLRFVQHFSSGHGDYTQERDGWLAQQSMDEVLNDMKQGQYIDPEQYDEIIK